MQGQLSQGHAGGDFLARHFSLAGYPKHGLSEWWPTVQLGLAWIAITWYCFVWAVCFVGYIQMLVLYLPGGGYFPLRHCIILTIISE